MREHNRRGEWDKDRPSVSQLQKALEVEKERCRTTTILKNAIAAIVVVAAAVVLVTALLFPIARDNKGIITYKPGGDSSVSLDINEPGNGEVLFYYNGNGTNSVTINSSVENTKNEAAESDSTEKEVTVTPVEPDQIVVIPEQEGPLANVRLEESRTQLDALSKSYRDKAVMAVVIMVIIVVVLSGMTIGFRHKER